MDISVFNDINRLKDIAVTFKQMTETADEGFYNDMERWRFTQEVETLAQKGKALIEDIQHKLTK